MTRPWHASARGLVAPLVAFLALIGASPFLFTSTEPSALPLISWVSLVLLGMLFVVAQPRFRERPGVSAGLFGVATWVLAARLLDDLGGSSFAVPAWLGGSLAVSLLAAAVAERPAWMADTGAPSGHVRGAALLVGLGAIVWVGALAARPDEARRATASSSLGVVEIPALPTVVRERLSQPGREALDVEVSSTAAPGGAAIASVSLVRIHPSFDLAGRTDAPCTVDVGPAGRTIEVLSTASTYEIRWPISPHGESFGRCVYTRAPLHRLTDEEVPHQATAFAWLLVLAPLFGLGTSLLAWRHRRRHARLARSPEVRVKSPGLAILPDGSPAIVPTEIPMGTSLVALRVADVRPDYRADARLSIDELALGEKNALLVAASRQIRTLELLALSGATLPVVCVVAVDLAGALLAFP